MPVVLVGTLDTKGRELAFVRDLLRKSGLEALVIDAGSLGPPSFAPEIDRERVFFRAGTSPEEIKTGGDRGEAVAAAAEGVASIVADLDAQRRVEGVFALGGSAGTTIGTAAMRAVRFGVPKVMVSTLASGQIRPFVGGSDIMMVHSVADIAGLNHLTRTVLTNAALAMVGMVQRVIFDPEPADEEWPVVAATMFGVTTPCVDRARLALEALGAEVLVFHATGVGGQAMEGLIRDGKVAGVLDLTTTELADELVGGILAAGPDRLEAAGRRGIPQVVSVGALDMVNFGPMATVPERFRGRTLHAHNPNVTLMRTTPEENAELGRRMAATLARSRGPTAVVLPRGGVSALDAPGKPFHDPEADAALFRAIEKGLAGTGIEVIAHDEHINDPGFADFAVKTLRRLLRDQDPRALERDRMTTSWATPDDLLELLTFLEAQGLPAEGLGEHLDDTLVMRAPGGRIVGSAALERHGSAGLLRSVVVAPELRGHGLGSRLVAALLNRAAADGVAEVLLLTGTARDFFAARFSFAEASREDYEATLAGSSEWRLPRCASVSLMRLALGSLEPA